MNPLLLHGDLSQMERNEVIQKFRKRETDVLVATDVAGKFFLSGNGQFESNSVAFFQLVVWIFPIFERL